MNNTLSVKNAGRIRRAGQKLLEAVALLEESSNEVGRNLSEDEQGTMESWKHTLSTQAGQLAGFAIMKKLPDRVPGDF